MSGSENPDPDALAKKLYYLLIIATVMYTGAVLAFIY